VEARSVSRIVVRAEDHCAESIAHRLGGALVASAAAAATGSSDRGRRRQQGPQRPWPPSWPSSSPPQRAPQQGRRPQRGQGQRHPRSSSQHAWQPSWQQGQVIRGTGPGGRFISDFTHYPDSMTVGQSNFSQALRFRSSRPDFQVFFLKLE
jgi:hypothetical protein